MAKSLDSPYRNALLAHLKEFGGGTVAEITFASGMKQSTVYLWVTTLYDEGVLSRTKRKMPNSRSVEHVFSLPGPPAATTPMVSQKKYRGILEMGLAARHPMQIAWASQPRKSDKHA